MKFDAKYCFASDTQSVIKGNRLQKLYAPTFLKWRPIETIQIHHFKFPAIIYLYKVTNWIDKLKLYKWIVMQKEQRCASL